ncbi:MAG: hypothetical protein ACT4NV_10960 [Rhodoferax sp.]
MTPYLLAAAALTVFVGLAHSVVGEWLVWRRHTLRTALGRQWGIVWASWHLATVLGAGLALVLVWLAQQAPTGLAGSPYLAPARAIAAASALSAALVAFATRGRHPGWLGLGGVALLVWLA